MAVIVNVLTFALGGLVLALVVLRMREQKKLSDIVAGLKRADHKFGRTLDRIETFADGVAQEKKQSSLDADDSQPTWNVFVTHATQKRLHYEAMTTWGEVGVRQVSGVGPMMADTTSMTYICTVCHNERRWMSNEWLEEDANEYELVSHSA